MSALRNTALLFTLPLLTAASLLQAQELPNEGPVPTKALIQVDTKNGAQLDPSMLKLEVNRHPAAITSVTPVSPQNAQVAILIDDGLRTSFGQQIKDFQNFITSLPAGTGVYVGYMQNGTVRGVGEGGFSKDHAAVADSLRLPFSALGISASPYFCLSEFVKHWPSNSPGARFVVMITNGVDPYNGSVSPLNQDSPYVQTAQTDAQRAGVAVYSIYYGLRGERGFGVSTSGSNYLAQVAEATGGTLLYNGTITPPSVAPYLNDFRQRLAESYQVGFLAVPNGRDKRTTVVDLKVSTKQSGLKVHGPEAIGVGAGGGTGAPLDQ